MTPEQAHTIIDGFVGETLARETPTRRALMAPGLRQALELLRPKPVLSTPPADTSSRAAEAQPKAGKPARR